MSDLLLRGENLQVSFFIKLIFFVTKAPAAAQINIVLNLPIYSGRLTVSPEGYSQSGESEKCFLCVDSGLGLRQFCNVSQTVAYLLVASTGKTRPLTLTLMWLFFFGTDGWGKNEF
jgi:hypothetical protein